MSNVYLGHSFWSFSFLHLQAGYVSLQSAGRHQPPLPTPLFKVPLLNSTYALLWSPHPFLNEARAKVPQRKGKHGWLACSFSSFCSYTIMHIVCTAPSASNPPFHVDFLSLSLSRSLSLRHIHTLFLLYHYVTAM